MKKYIHRVLEATLQKYLSAFPIVGITGPRQSGKSTMLKHLLSKHYTYITFDDYKMVELLAGDPEKFMRIYNDRVIFDEVHKAPHLFNLLKISVDNDRGNYGKFIITGSAQFAFMKEVSESLAGRIGLLSLLPFQFSEVPKIHKEKSIFMGSYPELLGRDYTMNSDWYSSYLDTYLNKDLRSLMNIGDLRDFRRFISILAGRCSQILNMSEISRDIGVTVATIGKWISVLEASYIIFLVSPFYKNFGKRVTKSPKIYFHDTGMVSYLLGIENEKTFENGNMFGHIFENYIVSEILKRELHTKSNAQLYYFRTSNGLEVDLIIDRKSSKEFIEIKSSETFKPAMISGIEKTKAIGDLGYLLYRGKNMKFVDDIKIINYSTYFKP